MWVGSVPTTVNSVVAKLLADGHNTYKVFIVAIGFGGYVYRNRTVWNGSRWSGFLKWIRFSWRNFSSNAIFQLFLYVSEYSKSQLQQ